MRDERDRWRRTVHVVATEQNDSSRWWVFSEGEVFEFARTQDGPTTHRLDESPSLSSPMPATVRQVHVSSGQEVRVGDTLILLEAMKMEMPLKAPRDGVVESVACQEGDLVTPGTPLVVLEACQACGRRVSCIISRRYVDQDDDQPSKEAAQENRRHRPRTVLRRVRVCDLSGRVPRRTIASSRKRMPTTAGSAPCASTSASAAACVSPLATPRLHNPETLAALRTTTRSTCMIGMTS